MMKRFILRKGPQEGTSVLEVLLAIIILAITSTVVLKFVLAGDLLFGRNILIENATQLAYNEAELLKAQAPGAETMEDAEYEGSMGGRAFVIKRSVMEAESVDSLISKYQLKGVELKVFDRSDSDKPIVTFKYLQGYNVK